MAAVKLSHLLIFTKQFSAMIGSQLQLVYVLQNLARETPQRRLRSTIEDVTDDVQRGVDLSDALAKFPRIFSSIYVNVVRAGMASGQLGDALEQVAQYLERVDELNRKVRTALSYPLFLLLAFFVVFNGMVFVILPQFQRMFESFGKELPAPTQFMLDIGAFYGDNWFLIMGGGATMVISFTYWILNPAGRRIWDQLKLNIPVLGRLWRMGTLSRFLRTLAVQMRNYVPLLESLRLSASASGNLYIEEIIYNIADDVERGVGIAQSFREHEVFSGIVLQMIASGEEAGSLDELLMSAATYFDSLLREHLNTITNLINPILTVIVGSGIAGMMIAAFLPVFEIGGAVR